MPIPRTPDAPAVGAFHDGAEVEADGIPADATEIIVRTSTLEDAVMPADDGWYGWTPNSVEERAAATG